VPRLFFRGEAYQSEEGATAKDGEGKGASPFSLVQRGERGGPLAIPYPYGEGERELEDILSWEVFSAITPAVCRMKIPPRKELLHRF